MFEICVSKAFSSELSINMSIISEIYFFSSLSLEKKGLKKFLEIRQDTGPKAETRRRENEEQA